MAPLPLKMTVDVAPQIDQPRDAAIASPESSIPSGALQSNFSSDPPLDFTSSRAPAAPISSLPCSSVPLDLESSAELLCSDAVALDFTPSLATLQNSTSSALFELPPLVFTSQSSGHLNIPFVMPAPPVAFHSNKVAPSGQDFLPVQSNSEVWRGNERNFMRADVMNETSQTIVAQDLAARMTSFAASTHEIRRQSNEGQPMVPYTFEVESYQRKMDDARLTSDLSGAAAMNEQYDGMQYEMMRRDVLADVSALGQLEQEQRTHTIQMVDQNIQLQETQRELEQYRQTVQTLWSQEVRHKSINDDLKLRLDLLDGGRRLALPDSDGAHGDAPDTRLREQLHRRLAGMIIRQHDPQDHSSGRIEYPPEMQAFYGAILCIGGCAVYMMVAALLGGPALETMKTERKNEV